jgi:hypothetical protein
MYEEYGKILASSCSLSHQISNSLNWTGQCPSPTAFSTQQSSKFQLDPVSSGNFILRRTAGKNELLIS